MFSVWRMVLLCVPLLALGFCSDSGKNSPPGLIANNHCPNSLGKAENTGINQFLRKDAQLNLNARHGFNASTWSIEEGSGHLEQVMITGGLTAAYLNQDCWPDIIFASGDENGMVAYLNESGQKGFTQNSTLLSGTNPASSYKHFTGVAVADLNGDYKRELVFANLFQGSVVVMSSNDELSKYHETDRLPMNRSTYGISFGDLNKDHFLDMFVAHWSYEQVTAGAPVLWINTDGLMYPYDAEGGTSHTLFDQRFNFSAQFADIRNSGSQDLLVASDFNTSSVLLNDSFVYEIVTDKEIITDKNGMGSALGDIDNDGLLDWFVTAISLPDNLDMGKVYGNRLYKNNSTKNEIIFSDITGAAGVRDGSWGWAACMADFNQDGFIDIFHVNGFAYIPESLRETGLVSSIMDMYALSNFIIQTIDVIPRLFINNGNGSFSDSTVSWGIDVPSEGRGVICFDYDRDGDIDIGLVDHSTGIQFFENQVGNGKNNRFLNIHLVGKQPNTDAIGTKVYLSARVDEINGIQRQMRASNANSNFSSQNLPDIHFGTGNAQHADYLRIEWPDNTGLLCNDVTTNQFLVFDQRDQDWPKSDTHSPNCNWYNDVNLIPAG